MQSKYNKNQNKVQTKVPAVSIQEKWNNSIFIPAIPFAVTKNQLKDAMESNIGKVHRIDFATFNSDSGTGRRAFVHFDHTYPTDFTKVLRQEIAQKGHFDVSYPKNHATVAMNLRIMMNKNPVPETDKTIHQVASEIDFMGEKHRIYEETFLQTNEQILELQAKNRLLEEENKAMKQYMENLFHLLKNLESEIRHIPPMPMPMSMPMPMPMPMPMHPIYMHGGLKMPGFYPVQAPRLSTISPMNVVEEGNYDYDYEELEQGEIYSSEEEEEDTQGEMKLSEIM